MSQYYPPPQQQQPPPTRRYQFDRWTIGMIAAGGLAFVMCTLVGCVVILGLVRQPPPPATPRPTVLVAQPSPLAIATPLPPATPTFNPASVGQLVNPFDAARLDGMTAIQIDALRQGTGNYERIIQINIGSVEMDRFVEALNIANFIQRPNGACPNHLRLTINRADQSVALIGVCLSQLVVLRGADITGLGGGDLPMGPFFTDVICPYLPADYKSLLGGCF